MQLDYNHYTMLLSGGVFTKLIMFKTTRILLLLGLLVTALVSIEAQAATTTVDVLHAEAVINPVLAD